MTMSALSASNGTSAAAAYVLPTRLEQLVGDCFDEEQYATGLATLSSLVGPNVFPSQHLVQQLLVLCISSPNAATAASTGLISKKRKRLNATAFSQIVIDASTIADVNAFLHRWLLSSPTSSSFASHLLAALPPFDHTDEDADETIVARRRVRRSSHSSGASEEQGSPIVEAVGEVVKDADNVWGMLASAAAIPTTPQKSDKRRRKGSDAAASKWNLPYDGQEDVEWSRDDDDRSMAKLLTCLVQERDDNLSLVDEQFDSWRDLLDPMAPYDCEGVWRLLAILVVAWKRQRQQVAAAAEGSKSAHALYDKLHLLKQIVSRPDVRKSYEDLATPLDVVFAGLACLDHWRPWYSASTSKQPHNPAYAQAKAAAQHRHAETAALLLVELCHLASLGAISADALARGIFERLSFVGLPQIQALNAAFEQDQRESLATGSQGVTTSPKAILCDAYVRHLDLEAALEKEEKKDKRSAGGGHGPLLGEEDLREVFDEDDTLCMREVAGRALRQHGSKEASSSAGRGSVEDEEEALGDEASLRLRLTACASSRASASVSPTISKKGGSNTQRRPSKEPSEDGRSANDEDDAAQSHKLLEKDLAAASQALASLRRWEILAFVEKAYRQPVVSDSSSSSSSSTARRLSLGGLQPTRLSAAFETTVQDVAREALDVLQEQHRRRRRSGQWSHVRSHSRRGSNVSNASSVGTAASGQSHSGRAFSKTPSPLPESVAPGGTAGPSTADQHSVRPKSGRTSKPPPRMGISRRSRGLSSSTARSTATPAALGQGQQQQATVSPITDADDDEEDEEDEEMKIARKRVREAEAREDWLLRVLLRETVARLETLRGRMGAVQMGVGTGGGGTRTGGS